MTRTLRHTITAAATLAFMSTFAGSSKAEEIAEWFETLAKAEKSHTVSICVSSSSRNAPIGTWATEMIALDLKGNALIRELRGDSGGFGCVDIPYEELTADLEADRTTGVATLLIRLRGEIVGRTRRSVGVWLTDELTGEITPLPTDNAETFSMSGNLIITQEPE